MPFSYPWQDQGVMSSKQMYHETSEMNATKRKYHPRSQSQACSTPDNETDNSTKVKNTRTRNSTTQTCG